MKHFLFAVCMLTALLPLRAQQVDWSTNPGSTGYDDFGGLSVDGDGNIIQVGSFVGSIDLDPGTGTFPLTSSGSYDIYIQKLDKDGNFLWGGKIGGTNGDYAYGVTTDNSGRVYVTGRFQGNGIDFDITSGTGHMTSGTGYGADGFILKLDANGNYLWSDLFGGTGTDVGQGIEVDANGNMYVCGTFQNSCIFDPYGASVTRTSHGGGDLFLMKLNSTGDLTWIHTMGSYFLTYNDQFGDMALKGNEIFLTGDFMNNFDHDGMDGPSTTYQAGFGNIDFYVIHLDSLGNTIKSVVIGGTSNDVAEGLDISSTGNVSLAGRFGTTVDFDPGVGTFNATSAGGYDGFMMSLNDTLGFLWAATSGCLDQDYMTDIEVDDYDNLYFTGVFLGTIDVDFETGPYAVYYNFSSNYDTYVLKTNDTGAYLWSGHLAGTDDDYISNISLGSGIVAVGGEFNDSLDLDMTTGTNWLVSHGNYDPIVIKIGICPSFTPSITFVSPNLTTNTGYAGYQWFLGGSPISGANSDTYTPTATGYYQVEITDTAGCTYLSDSLEVIITGIADDLGALTFSLFPNPAQHQVQFITAQPAQGNETLMITDLRGAVLQQISLQPGETSATIDLSTIPAGMYLVEYRSDNNKLVSRLAVH